MSIPTLCLSLLCLLLLVYPGAMPSILSNMLYGKKRYMYDKKKISFWIFNVGIYFLITILIVIQPEYSLIIRPVNNSWLWVVSLIMPFLIIGIELMVGVIISAVSGKKISKLSVDERIGKEKFFVKVAVLIVAAGEEVVFRGLGYEILCQNIMLSETSFLVISAFLYGINHIHEGFEVFLEKIVSGAIFGILFLASEKSVIVPLIAHVLENVIIIVWSRRAYE